MMMPEWRPLDNDVWYWMDTTDEEEGWRLRLLYKKYVASCSVNVAEMLLMDPEDVLAQITERSYDLKEAIDSGRYA